MDISLDIGSIASFINQYEYMNPSFRQSMEDTIVIKPHLQSSTNMLFAALMDGHGGCATAHFVASRIVDNLCEALQETDFTSYEDALRYTFLLTDAECRMQNLMASGCTCASLLIVKDMVSQDNRLIVANIGDSRVVLYSNSHAVRLSHDHKSEDKEEIIRIQSTGGLIINRRVMGLLAVTRSFGDHCIKEYVTADPYISSRSLTAQCEFIVIGCDGVFDVLNDTDVCIIVKQCIDKGIKEKSAQCIVEEAVRRDSRDNISCIVIGL